MGRMSRLRHHEPTATIDLWHYARQCDFRCKIEKEWEQINLAMNRILYSKHVLYCTNTRCVTRDLNSKPKSLDLLVLRIKYSVRKV
jgi:hypothetical protein